MRRNDVADTTDTRDSAGADRTDRRPTRLGLVQLYPRTRGSPFTTWPLGATTGLGRDPRSDICLIDPRVSRRHALFCVRASHVVVEDQGSRHGTFLNGRPLLAGREDPASVNDVLRCGNSLLLVTDDVELYASPPQTLARSYVNVRHDLVAGPKLFQKWQEAIRAAGAAQPVLITGESGTGKEAVARLVHAARKKPGPFVALNLAAIPDGLFEAELFGHARGAFSGSVGARMGAFREATGGVLFLDEIGDLRQDLQVKLLRAFESGVVRPLGAAADVPIEVRVVAATSRNLQEALAKGAFRADLYYRLAGIVISLPPLRQRRDDIVAHTLQCLHDHASPLEISTQAMEKLLLNPWPGNVRELHHALHQATSRADECGARVLSSELIPDAIDVSHPLRQRELSAEALLTALTRTGGNASRAAKLLGVSRATLYNLCSRHQLKPAAVRGKI